MTGWGGERDGHRVERAAGWGGKGDGHRMECSCVNRRRRWPQSDGESVAEAEMDGTIVAGVSMCVGDHM